MNREVFYFIQAQNDLSKIVFLILSDGTELYFHTRVWKNENYELYLFQNVTGKQRQT